MINKKIFFTILVFIGSAILVKLTTIFLWNYFSIKIENSIAVCFLTMVVVVYVIFTFKSKQVK